MRSIASSCRRAAAALALPLLLSPTASQALGVFIAPCDTSVFPDVDAPSIQCSLGSTASNAIGSGTAAAGTNFFENHLSPIHFYGDTDDFDQTGIWLIASFPTWDKPGDVLTYLGLDGSVKLQGPGSSVDIALYGLLGGPALVIEQSFAWTGAPTEDILSLFTIGEQAQADTALELLVIRIVGRARYDVDGSPTFLGAIAAIPEPQTYALMAGGLGLLGWMARRRRVV